MNGRFCQQCGSRRITGAAAFAALHLLTVAALLSTACAVRVPRSLTVAIPGPAGRLEGALFLPDGPGPHAAMVLVHGSLQNSRLDLVHEARSFATRGIAVLAYDKRGTGGSEGALEEANFNFLAHDAIAAARYLRARPEVDSTRVGFWGIGQGGWVAPLAAALDTATAFVVVVSAPVVQPLEQLAYQRTEQLVARGMARNDAEAVARLRRRIWEFWLGPPGTGSASSDSLRHAFESARGRAWFAGAVVSHDLPETLIPDEGMGSVNHPARWWLAKDMPAFWSLQHDPIGVLERVRAPILALYGEKDRDVPVEKSVVNFRAAMRRAGNKRSVAYSFPGADHSLNVRKGPGPFARIEPAPGYHDTVIEWLGRVPGAGFAANPSGPPFMPR